VAASGRDEGEILGEVEKNLNIQNNSPERRNSEI
jgi:hypothetical protein